MVSHVSNCCSFTGCLDKGLLKFHSSARVHNNPHFSKFTAHLVIRNHSFKFFKKFNDINDL